MYFYHEGDDASGGQGLSPWNPGSQMLRTLVPRVRHIWWRAAPV